MLLPTASSPPAFFVVSDRDIAITGAVVRLEPLFAMVELDDLVAAAESKGAVGRLLTVLPRYARATQVRKTAFVRHLVWVPVGVYAR